MQPFRQPCAIVKLTEGLWSPILGTYGDEPRPTTLLKQPLRSENVRLTTRDIARVSMFAAFACTAAMMTRFAGNVVPFSLLPLVSVLGGCLLGRRLGSLAMALYAAMGLVGLPVFATAPFGGMAYILKPSFGFIPGFVLGAYLSGGVSAFLSSRVGPRHVVFVIGALIGILGIYAVGLPYLWFALNVILGKASSVSAVVRIGLVPFIVPDVLKAVAAGLLASEVARRVRTPQIACSPPVDRTHAS